MPKKTSLITAALIIAGMALASTGAHSAETKAAEPPKAVTPAAAPPYERSEALLSVINPHNQIGDTGEVLWGTCVVCHKDTPAVKAKSIKEVNLYYPDNPDQLCRNCHTVKKHPGSEGISVTMSGYTAPDHLVVPSKTVLYNIRLSLKEIPMILPLDPKSGKILCATCHNPHERGLLPGRPDWGADYSMRIRSAGIDICQYCHRK